MISFKIDCFYDEYLGRLIPLELCSESCRILKEEKVDSSLRPESGLAASETAPLPPPSVLSDWASESPRDSYVTQSISSWPSGAPREAEALLDAEAKKLGSGIGLPTGLIGEAVFCEVRFIMDVRTSAMRCMKLAWTVGRACPISVVI